MKQNAFPKFPVRGEFVRLLTQMAACKSGMGLAMLPLFIGNVEPDLVRVGEGTIGPRLDVWILTHRDVRSSARIRAFSSFLGDAIIAKRNLLEGM